MTPRRWVIESQGLQVPNISSIFLGPSALEDMKPVSKIREPITEYRGAVSQKKVYLRCTAETS